MKTPDELAAMYPNANVMIHDDYRELWEAYRREATINTSWKEAYAIRRAEAAEAERDRALELATRIREESVTVMRERDTLREEVRRLTEVILEEGGEEEERRAAFERAVAIEGGDDD